MMMASINKDKDESRWARQKIEDLPIGTIVNIEGTTLLRADKELLEIRYDGSLGSLADYVQNYFRKKEPAVVHGILKFYPLGF